MAVKKGQKILEHPDKEMIIRLLTEGEPVREIEAILKKKYFKDKSKWINSQTLQYFRKDQLNLTGKVLDDIKKANQSQKISIRNEILQRQLEDTNAYKDKVNEIANTYLDVGRTMAQMDAVVQSRIEYWYNLLASGEVLPQQADNELRKYIDQQITILHQYKKLVEGMADKTVDYNINVNVMNDQIAIIRDAVRDVLLEMGPDKAALFLDKLQKRIQKAVYRSEQSDQPSPIDLKQLTEFNM